MLKNMYERRKDEIKIMSIVLLAIVIIFGTGGVIFNNPLISDIGIMFGVSGIVLAELIIGMCMLPNEFNYAIGMGKTRKDFYRANLIISMVYVCISYLTVLAATLVLALIGHKSESFEFIINPAYIIILVVFTLFVQMYFFWLGMEHPKTLWMTGVLVSVTFNGVANNDIMKITNAIVKDTALENYSEFVAVLLVAILLTVGFTFISKKVLRMQVTV